MSDRPKASISSLPISSQGVTGALQVHMRALFQEQAELLDETRKVMTAWTKRRAEGLDANFRAFHAKGGCTDPAGMRAAYSSWLTNSMDWILADMTAVREEALRLAAMGRQCGTAAMPQGVKAFTLAIPMGAEPEPVTSGRKAAEEGEESRRFSLSAPWD